MSLYTPIFPTFHEPNGLRKGLPENASAPATAKQQTYADFLRDVHLFLSTQSDVLSPPSRPSSPLFGHRVQKVRDEVQNILKPAEHETSSGKWARVSQTLKLGCVRGRPWSVSKADPHPPTEETDWILPDEESEWIEWETKREESRRLKARNNTSQHVGGGASPVPDSQLPSNTSFAKSQLGTRPRGRPRRDVSPATLRAAKEKVRKWQASVVSEPWNTTTSGSSPVSTRAVVAKSTVERLQRSSTLDFAVVKPSARTIAGKKGKRPLSRPAVRSGPAPTPSHKSKSPKPSKVLDAPAVSAPVDVDKSGSERPSLLSPVKDDKPKIADIPETPYIPPSFPTHLETSTPLPDPKTVFRAKPPPILPLPASSSTPPPSTPANPPEDRQLEAVEACFVNNSPSLPSQINAVHVGKRSREFSTSLDGVPHDPSLAPPAKKLRTLSQNSNPVSENSKPMSPNGGLDIVPDTRDARHPNTGAVPSLVEIAISVPSTPGKKDHPVMDADVSALPEKIPSPTKSVKSYFSAPDSDPADSPVKANLLLESPVSPMLSYAQNPSGFLPQFASTQVGNSGSPTGGRINGGLLGMGFSSQFDVEKHVDRVSELLEKDVDFDGWLRDVRTVETSQD